MNTTLCPGTGCAKAETCLRAIRYKLEPDAPSRSDHLLFNEESARAGLDPIARNFECLYYCEDNGKRASREPNTANLVGAFIDEHWPELKSFPAAWVTGSTVWRVAYAMDRSPDADLDVFVCDDRSYLHVVAAIRKHETPAPADKPKRRGSNEGERLYTKCGWVDVWLPRPVNADAIDDMAELTARPIYDPFHALRQYPPSTHGHCRIAYNPYSRALITVANEYANDEGAAEYHERAAQWHLVEAERLIKLARRSA